MILMSETRVKPFNNSSQTLRSNIEGMILRLPNYTSQVKLGFLRMKRAELGGKNGLQNALAVPMFSQERN